MSSLVKFDPSVLKNSKMPNTVKLYWRTDKQTDTDQKVI